MKMVRVEWEDSCAHHGWRDKDCEDYVLAKCTSVGFLIKKSREVMSIALSMIEDDKDVSEVICIPRSCIKSVKELRCR